MLAYVFWHQPRPGVEQAAYEEAQRGFHGSLQVPSACFRIAELPFGDRGSAYEDWYLVESWGALGALNERAVDRLHAPHHNRAAAMAAEGWGAVYSLVKGSAAIPDGVEWADKPRGENSAELIAALPHDAVWRRQLVLGPAPELCAATTASAARTRI
jgi:hypothetical protein